MAAENYRYIEDLRKLKDVKAIKADLANADYKKIMELINFLETHKAREVLSDPDRRFLREALIPRLQLLFDAMMKDFVNGTSIGPKNEGSTPSLETPWGQIVQIVNDLRG